MKLTDKQKGVLNAIDSYYCKHGFSPTIRDISEKMGWASSSTAHACLNRLKDKGYITWIPLQPRTFKILNRDEEE